MSGVRGRAQGDVTSPKSASTFVTPAQYVFVIESNSVALLLTLLLLLKSNTKQNGRSSSKVSVLASHLPRHPALVHVPSRLYLHLIQLGIIPEASEDLPSNDQGLIRIIVIHVARILHLLTTRGSAWPLPTTL